MAYHPNETDFHLENDIFDFTFSYANDELMVHYFYFVPFFVNIDPIYYHYITFT